MANSLNVVVDSGSMTVIAWVQYHSDKRDDKWKDYSNFFTPDGVRQPLANIDAFLAVCPREFSRTRIALLSPETSSAPEDEVEDVEDLNSESGVDALVGDMDKSITACAAAVGCDMMDEVEQAAAQDNATGVNEQDAQD